MFSTREEVTDYGLQLTNTHNNICYEWATGLGKSLMSIKVIEKYGGENGRLSRVHSISQSELA